MTLALISFGKVSSSRFMLQNAPWLAYLTGSSTNKVGSKQKPQEMRHVGISFTAHKFPSHTTIKCCLCHHMVQATWARLNPISQTTICLLRSLFSKCIPAYLQALDGFHWSDIGCGKVKPMAHQNLPWLTVHVHYWSYITISVAFETFRSYVQRKYNGLDKMKITNIVQWKQI